jgi:hypothetical protein
MKRPFFALLGCLLTFAAAHAQADHKLDPQTLQNDSVILQQVIMPALHQPQEPDWKVLRTTIVTRYNDSYGDRNVTKAKIYYFYGKDWAQFSTAIVQYTQAYECKDDLTLMNGNAKMILAHSQNPAEWKAAQGWVRYATEKAPSNEKFKATYDALTEKLQGK